eukprot:13205280-Alexandrium_andersonii.AAC.1
MTDSSRSPRGRDRTPEDIRARRAANVDGPDLPHGRERGRRRRDGPRHEPTRPRPDGAAGGPGD